MKEFTEREKKFLIENDDKFTISQFAQLFKCTGKEVYAFYDKITPTFEYWEHIENKPQKKQVQKHKEEKYEQVGNTFEDREGSDEDYRKFIKEHFGDRAFDTYTDDTWEADYKPGRE